MIESFSSTLLLYDDIKLYYMYQYSVVFAINVVNNITLLYEIFLFHDI